MWSDGKHSSCITTICFPGIHYRQLCCQLSSCLLVCHMEKLLMDWLNLLKTGHFCFFLKCVFNTLSFLQNIQQAFILWFSWPLTTGQFHIHEWVSWKKLYPCQLSSKLLMELGKDHKKENEMVKWEEGSPCAYRLRSVCKCAAVGVERENLNFYYLEVCDRRRMLRLWVLI